MYLLFIVDPLTSTTDPATVLLQPQQANKQQIKLVRSQKTTGKLENGQLLSGCGIVQNIARTNKQTNYVVTLSLKKNERF